VPLIQARILYFCTYGLMALNKIVCCVCVCVQMLLSIVLVKFKVQVTARIML